MSPAPRLVRRRKRRRCIAIVSQAVRSVDMTLLLRSLTGSMSEVWCAMLLLVKRILVRWPAHSLG